MRLNFALSPMPSSSAEREAYLSTEHAEALNIGDVGRALSFSQRDILLRIVRPAGSPSIMSGLRL